MIASTDEIFLREICHEDLERTHLWRNDQLNFKNLGGMFRFANRAVESQWLENYLKSREKTVRLAIIEKKTNTHFGNIYLTDINWQIRSAEFSIVIGDTSFQGKGYGSTAGELVLDHAFADLNLNRVYLTVNEDNQRAIQMYLRIGFKKEGLLRESAYKAGKYIHQWNMSILKSDWQNRKSQ